MSWNQEMLVLPLLVSPLWVRYVIRAPGVFWIYSHIPLSCTLRTYNRIAKMCKAQVKMTLWCVLQSTFLSLMTSTESEAASYEFTTLTCIPGVIQVLASMAWWHLDPFGLEYYSIDIVLLLYSIKGPTFSYWIFQESLRVLPKVKCLIYLFKLTYNYVVCTLSFHNIIRRNHE